MLRITIGLDRVKGRVWSVCMLKAQIDNSIRLVGLFLKL